MRSVNGVTNCGDEFAAVGVAEEGALELEASAGGEGVAHVVAIGGIGVGDGEGGVGNE